MNIETIIERYSDVSLKIFGGHSKGVDYIFSIDNTVVIFTYNSENFDNSKFGFTINSNMFLDFNKFDYDITEEKNKDTDTIVVWIKDKR